METEAQATPLPEAPVALPETVIARRDAHQLEVARLHQMGQSLARMRRWSTKVVPGAALAAMLICAGWLATKPRPAAPLSDQQLRRSSQIEQQVPFGPVIIRNQEQPAPPLPQAPYASQQTKPSAAISSHRETKAHSAQRSKPHNRIRADGGGDEVSVRHFRPGDTQTTADAHHIRRISDH
jgi:hypothetical protein